MVKWDGPIEPPTPGQNTYDRTQWYDEIVDPVTGEVLEEGTVFWAEYANNIEWGIWNAFQYINLNYRAIIKLQALMELFDRAPVNNGTYSDTFDGAPNRMTLLDTQTDITQDIVAGTTVIPVSDASNFDMLSQVLVYDANNSETTRIASVNQVNNTITVTGLVNGYDKGAKLAYSSVDVNTQMGLLEVKPFEVFNVELVEVV